MKTLFVLSDTHGNRADVEKFYPIMAESDYIVHLGDTSSDGSRIKGNFPEKTYLLNGNCDLAALGEEELVLEVENVKILCCHGHRYSVKRTLEKLAERAKELGCTVALYGHTHMADERIENGVLCVNPGTMSRYSHKTYCYLVINDKTAVAKIADAD